MHDIDRTLNEYGGNEMGMGEMGFEFVGHLVFQPRTPPKIVAIEFLRTVSARIEPTVPVLPTFAGLRANRDEVLDDGEVGEEPPALRDERNA